jgi:DNA-binding response OmpR family regulator
MVDLGDVALNLESRRAFVRGEEIRLTKTECDLLAYLMTHAGEVLSSQELLQQVWGFPQGTTDTGLVRWHVRNLRSKIETDPEQPEVILTISRRGYVFAGGEEE